MTLGELKTMLTGISGFSTKVAYRAFPVGDAPALPFICFLETGSDGFAADGKTYYSKREVDIELYSETRDLTSESSIEAALDANGLYYDRDVDYIDDERMYITTYTIEV